MIRTLALSAVFYFAGVLSAQMASTPLTVQPIRGGVYFVKGGSGANTGFIAGKTEVIVIDAKMTETSAKEVLAEIKRVTPNPVGHIILTHSDGDHVNGLSGYPKGLPIIAHASTKRDMEEAFKTPQMSALAAYLPNDTLTADRQMTIDGVNISLRYFGPAHTSGDLVVYLPDQKVAFVGDLVFVGRDPLIHVQKGGTSAGLVRNLNGILALDADTFLSGHADPLTKSDVKAALASIEEKRAKVAELVKQGKSLDEIKKEMGVPTAAAGGQGGPSFPSLAEVIYQELTAKKP
jgi:glyoxylase-like metal-dependent hydrolase (beta-lactamase superfamily II)